MCRFLDGNSRFADHPAIEYDLEHARLLPRDDLREHHLERERRRVRTALEAGGFALATDSSLALVRSLPWDTSHFGLPCADLARLYSAPGRPAGEASAIVDRIAAECRARGITLLSARVQAGEVEATQALCELGARLVDTSVELGARLPLEGSDEVEGDACSVRESSGADVEPLHEVAATFTENRFHRDPAIPRERARGVYERWVSAAIDGEHGRLLVAQTEGRLDGFATYHPPDDDLRVGVIGLVAVRPEARGRKILSALVHACVRALPEGTAAVATSTQVTNASALRGFGRCGLHPVSARHIFHLWL